MLISLVAGCAANPTPTPAPQPTSTIMVSPSPSLALSTRSGAIIRATLPPAWTPTFTLTPSRTFTPSPQPPTPTIVPRPTLEEVCDSLVMRVDFAEGSTFTRDESINFIYGTTFREVLLPDSDTPVAFKVRFLAVHEETGDNLGADLLPGDLAAIQIPASELDDLGVYRWTVSIVSDAFGEACIQTGTFVIIDEANSEAGN